MRKAVLGVMACVVLLAPCGLRGQETGERVSGLVIEPGADYVQIKSGYNEIFLYYSDSSRFLKKDGSAAGKEVVEICQLADARYTIKDGRYVLLVYRVLAGTYCKK